MTFFYYIIAYDVGGMHVKVNVYDAENDNDTVYDITPPDGLTTVNLGDVDFWMWTIRKQSDTVLDFVVRGHTVTDFVYQHYTWTIGDEAFSYAGGYSYDIVTYGESDGFTLHGNTIIDVTRQSPKVYYHTYGLDDQAGAATEFLDTTTLSDFRVGFFHAGKYVHLIALVGEMTASGECPDHLDVPQEAVLEYSAISFDDGGGENPHSNILDTVTGYHAEISAVEMSSYSHCGASPDAGEMFFFFRYHRHWSSEPCPPEEDPWPFESEFDEWRRYIVTLSGGGLSLSGYDYDGTYTDNSPCIGPSDYSFASRIDPIGLIGESGDPNWVPSDPPVTPYLFHWNTRESSAVGVFYQGTDPGDVPTQGAGQRNDNQPLLISTAELQGSYWHNIWYTVNGGLYLDQATTLTGASTNFLPVSGFMGKWPVRHNIGKWAIFGPNTLVARGPNWQVV